MSGSHDKTIKGETFLKFVVLLRVVYCQLLMKPLLCFKIVWNIRTNSPWSVMTFVGQSGTVRCLHLMGNRLVSGSTDQTLKVWDLSVQDEWSSIACKVTMVGHTDTVRCVQVI